MDVRSRYDAIIDYLKENDAADVSTLSEFFQVSEMTIRRDLDRLEKDKILIRVHGGAKLLTRNMYEPSLDKRLKKQSKEKMKIGKFAASLVEAGDSIAIDDSSTTNAIIPYLKVPVTVVTNHINVAVALANNEFADVILLGGRLRKSSMSFVDKTMETAMEQYRIDKAFLSAKSIDLEGNIFDATSDEGNSKRVFLKNSCQKYFLFDHTKLNTIAFYKVCGIQDTYTVIMDRYEPDVKMQLDFKDYCEKHGVELHLI